MSDNEEGSSRLERARSPVRRLLHSLDLPLFSALLALIVGGSLFHGELKERRGDWSAFIIAGSNYVDVDAVPHPISVAEGAGYDGQFFYRLALDPWTPEHQELGGTLDSPAWRHQRILYPVLVWFASLGMPRLVPEAMVFVNLVALGFIGFVGGLIARRFGLHAAWGIVPAVYPGFFLTLVRDTAEIVAGACVIGGVGSLAIREEGREWGTILATAFFSLAVLARETTVLVTGALALVWLWSRIAKSETVVAWHNGLVPPVVMAMWHFVLFLRWGAFPSSQGSGNLGEPFGGMVEFALEIADRQDHWETVWLVELRFLALLATITLVAIWWSRAKAYVKVGYMMYFGLAVFLTRQIWVEDWSFMRALTELHVLAAVIILGSPKWVRIAGVVVWLFFSRWMFVEIDSIR